MNVIGYIRVSTQGQVKEGYSLSYQRDEIEAYCKEYGWNLIQVYQDAGVSGAKVDEDALEVEREGFQAMLISLTTRKVEYVVVLNTNRLWRSDIVKILIHREFKKYGVDVRSIEQTNYSIYKRDPSDVLINGMMELLDEYQRLEITMKLLRGRNKKAAQGGYAGGRAAFGYSAQKGEKRLQVNELQAVAVGRVYSLKKQYPYWSLSKIASQLNIENHVTQLGRQFTKVQVKRILDNEDLYTGIYRYGSIKSVGQHESIISSNEGRQINVIE